MRGARRGAAGHRRRRGGGTGSASPSYDVRSAARTRTRPTASPSALKLDAPLREEDGTLGFLDHERFGFLPTKPLAAPAPDEEGAPVVAEAPDLDAIRAIEALPAGVARRPRHRGRSSAPACRSAAG